MGRVASAARPFSRRLLYRQRMNEIFRVEHTGKSNKRRWNVWKYRVVGKGLEEKASMHPENKGPFQSVEEAIAFLKQRAPNQPE
jgi:hypothetical protein